MAHPHGLITMQPRTGLFSARSAPLAAAAWPARQAPLFVAAISPAAAQAARFFEGL